MAIVRPTTILRLFLMLGAVLFLAVIVLVFSQVRSHEGYFSPVYSPDGNAVYFIHRESQGLVTGLGWEFFSPPAHVFVWSDRFSLRKLDTASGQIDILHRWPPSPIENRRLRTYRGRAFTYPRTQLSWVEGAHLEYKISLSIPVQPGAEQHYVSRMWNNVENRLVEEGDWTQGWTSTSGDDVSPLSGDWELILAKGREIYPCAVAAFNSREQTVRVLLETDVYREIYPNGVMPSDLAERARRPSIERIQDLKDTHERLTRESLDAGMTEYEASLHVSRRMRDLGYYPKPPQLIARRLSPNEAERVRRDSDPDTLFAIEEMQFKVGLFTDIEKATDSPGEEFDKAGKYIIHNDYTTSQELNAFHATKRKTFYVERRDEIYEMTITEREEARRPLGP